MFQGLKTTVSFVINKFVSKVFYKLGHNDLGFVEVIKRSDREDLCLCHMEMNGTLE